MDIRKPQLNSTKLGCSNPYIENHNESDNFKFDVLIFLSPKIEILKIDKACAQLFQWVIFDRSD